MTRRTEGKSIRRERKKNPEAKSSYNRQKTQVCMSRLMVKKGEAWGIFAKKGRTSGELIAAQKKPHRKKGDGEENRQNIGETAAGSGEKKLFMGEALRGRKVGAVKLGARVKERKNQVLYRKRLLPNKKTHSRATSSSQRGKERGSKKEKKPMLERSCIKTTGQKKNPERGVTPKEKKSCCKGTRTRARERCYYARGKVEMAAPRKASRQKKETETEKKSDPEGNFSTKREKDPPMDAEIRQTK